MELFRNKIEELKVSDFENNKDQVDEVSVPVEDVTRYEKELFAFIDTKYPEIPEAIASSKEISEETEGLLKKALVEFGEKFK